jgi:hypothetical protein
MSLLCPPFVGTATPSEERLVLPLSAPYGVVEARVQHLSVCGPPFPSVLGASPHQHSRTPPCIICTWVESWSIIPTVPHDGVHSEPVTSPPTYLRAVCGGRFWLPARPSTLRIRDVVTPPGQTPCAVIYPTP